MAFILGQWGQINVSTNTGAPSIYNYINLSDTSIQMLTAGYFNSMAATLNVGDSILAVASDLTKLLRVSAVSDTNAQTYSVTVVSDFVSDVDAGLELLAEGTISAADVMTLATLPYQIVAAPGDGVMAIPVDLVLEYNFVTTPYTITGTPAFTVLWYDAVIPQITPAILTLDATGFVDQSVSMASFSQGYASTPVPLTSTLNLPLLIALDDGVDLTDGDGTLTYRLVYRLFF